MTTPPGGPLGRRVAQLERRFHRLHDDERGAVTVFVAGLLVTTLGFGGLIVDIGLGRQYQQAAQSAADAAALTGAEDLANSAPWTTVVSDVKTYVQVNFNTNPEAWVGCSDPAALAYTPDLLNADTCISSDSALSPTEVRVVLPIRTLPTTFGRVLGVNTLSINSSAGARIVKNGPCALCVLSPTASPGLSANGNGQINVSGGGVVVDSEAGKAASVVGNAIISAMAIGGPAAPAGFTTSGSGSYSPAPVNTPAVPDPLAGVPECPGAGLSLCPTTKDADVSITGGSAIITPGIYNNISVTGSGSLTMSPGTYIITNSMKFAGLGMFSANGVTIYLACVSYPLPCASGGQAGASYDIEGNGTTTLSGPPSGTFQGLTIFGDRNNNTTASQLVGNGYTLLTGTVYNESMDLTVNGNAGASTLNSMIIANTVTAGGSGIIDLTYQANQNAPIVVAELNQ